jgi:ACS family D-galactonate transporter-like MFS transporter
LNRTTQEAAPLIEDRQPARRTRARFLILALLTVGTLINYLDRTVISVAAPLMTKELGLSAVAMGVVFSAFSWTYAAAQIPGGILLDRIGVRLTYFWSVTIWSTFTLLQGLTTNLWTLIACRMGLGVAEAPAFPSNSRVLGTWFPQAERASATGVYSIGQYFGLAFLSPLLFWIAGAFGWRALLIIVGSRPVPARRSAKKLAPARSSWASTALASALGGSPARAAGEAHTGRGMIAIGVLRSGRARRLAASVARRSQLKRPDRHS